MYGGGGGAQQIVNHGLENYLSAPKSQRFLRFAIAMPIADPGNRSDFRENKSGEGRPSHLRVVSPGQRLSTGLRVRALCGCISCLCMYDNCNIVRPSCLVPVLGVFFWIINRAGEALGHSCSEVPCLFLLRVMLACVGRFPGREKPLATSVSRSPPRHLRTTGRPMGPATPHIQPQFSRINWLGSVGYLLGFWLVFDHCLEFTGEKFSLFVSWPFKFRSL